MPPLANNQLNMLKELGLKEYHAKALAHLLELGETKAPELSAASGVPKARIYGVLEDLADMGLIEIKPGRPTKYLPKPPKDIIQRVIENKKAKKEEEIKRLHSLQNEFESEFLPLYESSVKKSREPLLKTVSVGEPSERETNLMYQDAEEKINIVTRSMEWLPNVKEALEDAINRGINVKVLLLTPSLLDEEDVPLQEESLEILQEELSEVQIKFSDYLLPLRGSIVDPSYDYTSGKAIFLVEERGVPFKLRDAALTENPSLVAGMKRYFDLIWDHESSEVREVKG